MFNTILIANRGEIACRIIRSARRLGVRSVAVYSDADRHAQHVALADDAIYIGGSAASESYLRIDAILDAAQQTGAEAIHPGYGFLSENAEFCRRCDELGIVFIGPPVGAIEAMGSKSAAKRIMTEAGVPLLPGYHGEDQDPELLRNAAEDIGYPVLLKASAGGGGKGMRIVWSAKDFDDALAGAKREASKSFGDDKMLVEKYLTGPRHVEVQVFCDGQGNGLHLFERDCSLQRRHQKVIEEAPAPGMTEALRAAMGDAAVQAAMAINYQGAGTVEFLLADSGDFYFMEMNTRLQVEHPVTEMITGQDLVEWQLRVACGGTLPLKQEQLHIRGHAFEARIYAEDTDNQFLPQTGTLTYMSTPLESNNVRIDSGVVAGDTISIYYDPMIAKLVTWDVDRKAALKRLQTALAEFHIHGVTTNRRFLAQLAGNADFANEKFDTGFIDQHLTDLQSITAEKKHALRAVHVGLAALITLHGQQSHSIDRHGDSPWHSADNWRLNGPKTRQLTLEFEGDTLSLQCNQSIAGLSVTFEEQTLLVQGGCDGEQVSAEINGRRYRYPYANLHGQYCLFGDVADIRFKEHVLGFAGDDHNEGELTAPMNGTIVSLLAKVGDKVSKGSALMIMEAMKMEHTIVAPDDGEVAEYFFQAGDLVEGGAELLNFQAG